MARTSTYVNFTRQTEEAFNFYKTVFGTEFVNGIARFGNMPAMEGMPPMPEDDKNLVMHIELPITGGHILMGTDAPESMGFQLMKGNNVSIQLEPDTREEAARLFNALSQEGTITQPLGDTFWNAYFGGCIDQFGIHWLVNCYNK